MSQAEQTPAGSQHNEDITQTRIGEYFYREAYRHYSNRLGDAVTERQRFYENRYGQTTEEPLDDVLSALSNQHLNMFGHALKDLLKDRVMVDLGSGPPEASIVPAWVARAFGAVEYTGVDIDPGIWSHLVPDPLGLDYVDADGSFSASYRYSDMLGFLRELPSQGQVVFYLSGIQPTPIGGSFLGKKDRALLAEQQAYTHECLVEMSRATGPGGAVVIGSATSGFHPEGYGFTPGAVVYRRDRFGEAHISQEIFQKPFDV